MATLIEKYVSDVINPKTEAAAIGLEGSVSNSEIEGDQDVGLRDLYRQFGQMESTARSKRLDAGGENAIQPSSAASVGLAPVVQPVVQPVSNKAPTSAETTSLRNLNAKYVDSLFSKQTNGGQTIYSDGGDPNSLGWALGGNNTHSYIKRGADALGVQFTPGIAASETESGMTEAQPASYGRLADVAKQVGFDLTPYQRDGALDEAAAYAAMNERFKDVYRVSGHRDSLGDKTADSLDFVSSLYRRDGDNLVPVGERSFARGQENSKGFFGDLAQDLGPILPMALAFVPGLQGLAGTIGSGLGLSGTAASMVGSGVVGGLTSELTGGDFGKGFLGGAVGAGVSGLGIGADAVPGAVGKAIDSGLGRVAGAVATGSDAETALRNGLIGVGMQALSPEISSALADHLGIDPKNAALMTKIVTQYAPQLLKGGVSPQAALGLIQKLIPANAGKG